MCLDDCVVTKIHHVAFAVKDAEKALGSWERALGLKGKVYVFPDHKKGTLYIGDTMFAFIEYTTPTPRFTAFLNKHGEGLHHIALEVNNLSVATEKVKGAGLRMVYDDPGDAGIGICNFIVAEDMHADVELVEPDQRNTAMRQEVTGDVSA